MVRFFSPIRSIATALANVAFSPWCELCHNALDGDGSVYPELCSTCVQGCRSPVAQGCSRCGAIGFQLTADRSACIECQHVRHFFDQVIFFGAYHGKLQDAIVRMKYAAGQPLAVAVGRQLGRKIAAQVRDVAPELSGHQPAEYPDRDNSVEPIDLATCVSKHWIKRVISGVNSAESVLEGISSILKIPQVPNLLICRRRINKQSMLTRPQRRKNVRRAWQLSKGYDLTSAHILVVDDTMTTGATADEAARALKRAGARRVTVAVVGRASRGDRHV